MTDTLKQQKNELRATVKSRVASMNEDERRQASTAACTKLATLEPFRHASVIMLYMPLADEIDLTPFAIGCFRAGKTVCVPTVDWERRDMRPVEVASFNDDLMQIDEHGLRSPRDGRPMLPSVLDMVIVPGIAFDVTGRRLGRGGGFYDRFLARLHRSVTTVGLAYDVQVVDQVPTAENDRRVEYLATDRRLTHCVPAASNSRA